MIGQLRLRKEIGNLNLDTISHTILIEGKKGSGRHTLFNLLCQQLDAESSNLRVLGINDKTINDLILSPTVHLCLLDLDAY